MFTSLTILCMLCVSATFADSEIEIDGTDGPIKCGDTVDFTWKIDDADKVPDGTILTFGFREDIVNPFAEHPFIVKNLGTVAQAEGAKFTYTFPKPLPEAWTNGVNASVANDGKAVAIFLWAEKNDDPTINSESKLTSFEVNEDFQFSCCPEGYPGCACNNGACNDGATCTEDVCVAGETTTGNGDTTAAATTTTTAAGGNGGTTATTTTAAGATTTAAGGNGATTTTTAAGANATAPAASASALSMAAGAVLAAFAVRL
eukprot:TRINITY_DN5321_c0_g1_i1.p1 TRINITY_DN5321_c0_g1~~TRINITY_DN5321_c0_g1_i1.p1  ORF type:complete len:276 (-),score=90.45 TRINITY_DN5321_c0_g1_i1:135-914(-)